MSKFNPFRISFDKPLPDGERSRARVAAIVIAGVAIVCGLIGLVALLRASSGMIGAATNASTPEVRLLASDGEDPAGKACEDQTWPYIEARCLKRAEPGQNQRSTPKHGLGAQTVALPDAPATEKANLAQSPNPTAAPVVETTGSAPRADDTKADADANTDVPQPTAPAVVLPTPRPSIEPSTTRTEPEAARQQATSDRPLSRRELLRLQREERMRRRHEKREEARRERLERKRARAEARDRKRGERIVRRWTEYTYRSPNGGTKRVIVIRRGSLDDDFFRTIR